MKNELYRTLKEVISIESVAEEGTGTAPYGQGPASALRYMLDRCRALGFKTVNADGRYGYAEIGEGDELVGILCHLDVVPAGDGWHYPPFEGTIENDRLYGRGSTDDKGPAVASIFAMKRILDRGVPNKRIRIIFGQTEENGEWTDIEDYKNNEEIPDYGFTPDGDFPAISLEKGLMVAKITMPLEKSGFMSAAGGSAPNMVPDHAEASTAGGTYYGKGRSSHGCAPWAGENAIDDLMKKVASAEGSGAPVFAEMYNDIFTGKIYGESLGHAYSRDEKEIMSLNAGKLCSEGNELCLYLDIRFPSGETAEGITEKLNGVLEKYGATAECIHQMDAVYIPENSHLMQSLLGAYRDLTGDQSEPLVIGGGTYARAMKNIVAFGPNFPGHENREHNSDEYILLNDLDKLVDIYEQALLNLLED